MVGAAAVGCVEGLSRVRCACSPACVSRPWCALTWTMAPPTPVLSVSLARFVSSPCHPQACPTATHAACLTRSWRPSAPACCVCTCPAAAPTPRWTPTGRRCDPDTVHAQLALTSLPEPPPDHTSSPQSTPLALARFVTQSLTHALFHSTSSRTLSHTPSRAGGARHCGAQCGARPRRAPRPPAAGQVARAGVQRGDLGGRAGAAGQRG